MGLKEECGVFGITAMQEVSTNIYNALITIQHRGQDSAGISTFNDKKFFLKRNVGLVTDIFKKEDLDNLKGNIGIGHVRYPTIGSSFFQDAQPIFSKEKKIVLAHNGNIANYQILRKKLEKQGVIFKGNCDAELILNIFIQGLNKNKNDLFKAAKYTIDILDGAYSVVLFNEKKQLFAFKDKHAIKPLVFAKKENAYAFSSESVAFNINDFEDYREVCAGEAILIDKDFKVTIKKLFNKSKNNHCFFEYIYFARPDSILNGKLIYKVRYNLGKNLAIESNKNEKADIVVPVPDTSRVAAKGYADEKNLSVVEGIMKNRYIGRTFIMPTQDKRKKAVNLKLNIVKELVESKNIILIDDSIVRGTTMKTIIEKLRKAKANKIFLKITCPPIISPCFYGVDLPNYDKLIAANKKIQEIKEILEADSLQFISQKGLFKSIGIPKKEFCTGCISEKYITKYANHILKNLKKNK